MRLTASKAASAEMPPLISYTQHTDHQRVIGNAAVAGSVLVGRQSGGKLPLIGNRARRSASYHGELTHSTHICPSVVSIAARRTSTVFPSFAFTKRPFAISGSRP